MTEFYQVLGGTVPRLLGREQILADLESHLLKPTPDHVSVIGFARYGKSVLLNHLAEKYRPGNDYFRTALYIDFRHATPTTDEDFRFSFAKGIKLTVEQFRPEITGCIDLNDSESIYELLDLAFGELDRTGDRLLAVLDGFDHVLAASNITRMLWDNMLELARRHSSLTLVTGSRRPLRELCTSEESQSSDFWEIFYDTPLEINKFDDDDWDGFLRPMREKNITIEPVAKQEIVAWTGGVPILAAALMRELYKNIPEGTTLSRIDVDQVATRLLSSKSQILSALWGDCSEEIKSDLVAAVKREIPLKQLSHARRVELEERGFIQIMGNNIKPACKIMEQYSCLRTPDANELRRLFGSNNTFEENIQSVLTLRFEQTAQVDQNLTNHISNAIRDISPSPEGSLIWMRSIAAKALDLIWEKELPSDRSIPQTWINEWKRANEWKENLLDQSRRLPQKRGLQCNILRLATGTQNSHPVTHLITKTTYILVHHINSVGDFGQHRESRDFLNVGTAISFCMSAIALSESLYNDLNRK